MTATLEELTKAQSKTGEEIQRMARNYKRDSPDRKTKEYLITRIATLDQLWTEFDTVDSEIRAAHGDRLDHEYFAKNYFEGIKAGYEVIREDMQSRLEAIPEEPKVDEKKNNDPTQDPDKQVDDGDVRHKNLLMQGLKRLLAKSSTSVMHSPISYEIMIKAIETQWKQIQELHQKLIDEADEESLLAITESHINLEEEMRDSLVELHEGIRRCQGQAQVTSTNTAPEVGPTAIRLPKIELPKFDGDYLEWRQFYDLYTELIHKQAISAGQKMWYLKGSLAGEAEKLIRHMTISDANYNTAWRLICERYENKRLLVTALLNKLLAQSVITNESASAIKALHDTTQECILGLKNIGIRTESWDPMILHIMIKRLDKATHTLWEQSLTQPRQLQSLKEFLEFLETRFQSLEALGSASKSEGKRMATVKSLANIVKSGCPSCGENHPLFACHKWLQLSPAKRASLVKTSGACFNCLKTGHNAAKCSSRGCLKCGKKHNTLLHTEPAGSAQYSSNGELKSTKTTLIARANQAISLATQNVEEKKSYVLLSTAMVKLTSNNGTAIECRAVLDCGSQVNFVSERIVKELGLSESPEILNVEGIGMQKQRAQSRVNMKLESRINGFSTRLEAHVLPRIISSQPSQRLDESTWKIPANIQLADPQFYIPGRIDLLIGAGIYYSTLSVGQIKLDTSSAVLQNTVFGWVAGGTVGQRQPQEALAICGICSEDEEFRQQIEKFWVLDEAELPSKALTTAERRCEEHFLQNTRRNHEGRFEVKLPFKDDPKKLGESKGIAYQRLMGIERRLSTNKDLKQQYTNFMEEYIAMGHMKELNINEVRSPYCFLPHHCVVKPDSSSTKLRVVFDASAKTSTNVSLNDILAAGPTIQDDVFSILVRFRMPRFVFTADIEKMYRQIKVHPDDAKYQLIWWRKDPTDQLRCYELQTVTYGTTSAPYLAIRCLKLLAEEKSEQYPLGAEVLNQDFYVDDVLTGADSLSTAMEKQTQIKEVLASAGFKLRKWCANHPSLLKTIPRQDQEIVLDFFSKSEEPIKTVGLIWLPKTDDLCIRAAGNVKGKVTKRTAYSDIARLFDPLGIMGPVIVTAKIFLQTLWKLKCDWDAALPQELHSFWVNFREGLQILNDVKIPRHVFAQKVPNVVQIHIFADASEKAYGAAAYVRSIDNSQCIRVRLLCAKSRVAPIKTTTLPRLELCAAKLAAELAHRLKKDLTIRNSTIYLWSDSEIVLSWINAPSSSYQTFVANRISVIQQLSIPEQWRHVRSKDNPADVLSRGLMPKDLSTCNLWLYGPMFLHGAETLWPPKYKKMVSENDMVERRKITTVAMIASNSQTILQTIEHGNSFRKTQRIISFMLRFIKSARRQQVPDSLVLTTRELDEAQTLIVRIMQEEGFKNDLTQLKRVGEVAKDSNLSSLAPFVDADKVIRVGGRLEASNLTYQAKHPMLLPYTHPLTKCLLNDLHKENRHVGPQTLLAIARQTVWPVKGKTLARSVVQHCVQCAKAKPKLLTQMMGNLPADRVLPARPFLKSGVDFCGPISTHFKIRGKKPQKSYIAVFCCFATKSTHLEVVTDLSTEGFLGALRRFIARRGHCKTIYCDNATNFVGAKNLLPEVKEIIEAKESQSRIMETCSAKGIEFCFIPPRAPHFGGLWEAAVKSAKYLLQRSLGAASLTYEELETAVVEIEAILNSRPITPMSSDPNDLTALTPGHFLIGEPLTSTVDPKAESTKLSLITRWKLVSYIKNEFWKRWSVEYLNQLQHRYKWKQQQQNVTPGTMVLIKEDNLPPLKWALGRIINVIRGEDGLVRVVDVRTTHGIRRRPIHKLAPLPVSEEFANLQQDQPQEEPSSRKRAESHNNSHSEPKEERSNDTVQQDDQNYGKRKRLSMGSALLTLLLACLIVPPTTASDIEVNPFKHQPGIYFENIGAANVITNEWNLVVFYDLTPYWKEYEFLQKCTQSIKKLCGQIDDDVEVCTGIVNHLEHLLNELSTNNKLLASSKTPSRKRRGALNFVGNVANTLFGVLDSNYAEKMSQTIDEIKTNENYLVQLMKNQTSVMDATLNLMNREEQSISQQFRQLQSNIDQITKQINSLEWDQHQEKLKEAFTLTTLSIVLTATNFLRIQTSILDVITDSHHGKISALLLPPQQLSTELSKIKTQLPSSLELPIRHGEPLKYYALMQVQGKVTEKYAIFKVTIPLLSTEEFELFKIIPVPVEVNNTLVAINPSSAFLIINLHKDQYYPLTEHELQNCMTVDEGRHVCKQNHPIYRRGSTISACEISLINHAPPTSVCEVVAVENGPHWIQLHALNEWIYVLTNNTTINVVCGGTTTQHVLQGTGILKLRDRCLIRQPLVTIQGRGVYPSTIKTSYLPVGNITDLVNVSRPPLSLNYTASYTSYAAEINELRKVVQRLRNPTLPQSRPNHDLHQYVIGYVSLTLGVIIIIALAWKRTALCSCRRAEKKPTPAPRQRHSSMESAFNVNFHV